MEAIVERAHAAAEWLLRSIAACGGQGSAVYYSRWFRPRRGWAWPYPETTGYIIETLIAYGRQTGRREFIDTAIQQAEWILSLQSGDGALPGGAVVRGRTGGPSVFNTGQMVLGLVAAFDETGRRKYLDGAVRAAGWLADEVDDAAGTWTKHAYVRNYSPAYYTRVAWPMLEVVARAPDTHVHSQALRVLDTIAGWQRENGAIRNWAFTPTAPAFTHTIAYTIRGFLESARLLGDTGRRYEDVAARAAYALLRRMELRGRLAGAYDLQLKGRYWFTCLTGNCQMAIIWMKLYERLGDGRWLSAALKALEFVMQRQRMRARDPNVRGAIAGSSPFWGRYLTLRYPNWAAKFYLDALLLAYRCLQHLLENGPCASR